MNHAAICEWWSRGAPLPGCCGCFWVGTALGGNQRNVAVGLSSAACTMLPSAVVGWGLVKQLWGGELGSFRDLSKAMPRSSVRAQVAQSWHLPHNKPIHQPKCSVAHSRWTIGLLPPLPSPSHPSPSHNIWVFRDLGLARMHQISLIY